MYVLQVKSVIFLQEKELLRKKREEIEEAEQAKRNKVVVTFDLLGRKVFTLPQMDYYVFGCHLTWLLREFLLSSVLFANI